MRRNRTIWKGLKQRFTRLFAGKDHPRSRANDPRHLALEPLERRNLLAQVSAWVSDDTAQEYTGDSGSFVISLDEALGHDIDVYFQLGGGADSSDYYVDGAWYTGSEYCTTLYAGQTDQWIYVTPSNDAVNEGEETVDLYLSWTSDSAVQIGEPSWAWMTIMDDDQWAVEVWAGGIVPVEDESQPGVFTFTRSGGSDDSYPVVVEFYTSGSATQDTDYYLQDMYGNWLSNSIQIPAYEWSVDIYLQPINDAEVEDACLAADRRQLMS